MDFKECLKKRIAKEVDVDENLIISLLKTSQNKLDSEEKLELDEITSGSKISLLYDSLRELLEALAMKKGYKIYNHEGYTSFLKEILDRSLIGEEFDELRKIRNSINCYGKEISIIDAGEVLKRLERLRLEIKELIQTFL